MFEWFLIHLVEASWKLTLAMLLTETAMLFLCNIVNTEWVLTDHKSLDLSKSTEGHNSQWSPVLTQLSVISNSTVLYAVSFMMHSLTSHFQQHSLCSISTSLQWMAVTSVHSIFPSLNSRKAGKSMYIRTN